MAQSEAEQIYDKAFHRYISPGRWNTLNALGWKFMKATMEAIKELLRDGYEVRSGYMATSVHGFREYVLYYRRK